MEHDHYHLVYKLNPGDAKINPEAGREVFNGVCAQFEKENVRRSDRPPQPSNIIFPVLTKEPGVVPSIEVSEVLDQIPPVGFDYVFVAPDLRDKAGAWLKENRTKIIKPLEKEISDGSVQA